MWIIILLGVEIFSFGGRLFILLLNEDIVFLQLAYTWVKDPQKGINLSKGGDNSVIGPPLIMKSDTVWMCVCIFLLLLGKKWYVVR